MNWFSRWRASKRGSDELHEELEFHLAMREKWNAERGMRNVERGRVGPSGECRSLLAGEVLFDVTNDPGDDGKDLFRFPYQGF